MPYCATIVTVQYGPDKKGTLLAAHKKGEHLKVPAWKAIRLPIRQGIMRI